MAHCAHTYTRVLATRYGVHINTIQQIKSGRAWKHVEAKGKDQGTSHG